MIEDWEEAKAVREERKWPTWLYLALFILPALVMFIIMSYVFEQELLFSGITALAVMNGSINSVIAYLTIQLDTKSSESLQHLENINTEMDRLEATLEEANDKVQGFTNDLEEAKELFQRVGVDLDELDLEPVADVVTRLKENKDGLNQVLDHLRKVDVEDYINQAQRIDWRSLLGAAEEVMGFIEARNNNTESPMKDFKPTLPPFVPDDEEVDVEPEWEEEAPRLTLTREPKKTPPTLQRKPKKNLNLKR
jgi:hypothetical protein